MDNGRCEDRLASSLPVQDLVALVRERAQRDPERETQYFLDSDLRPAAALTPAGLECRARAIAAELQARGLAGGRALLLYPPGLAYVEAFYGCLFAGVLAVPAYPPNPARLRQTLPRLVSIVRDSTPAVVLTTSEALPLVQGLASIEEAFRELPVCATDTIPDAMGAAWRAPRIQPGDVAFIQYTSGSTSEPKGVLVSHQNILHTAEALARCVAYREWERLLIWLPTFHDMGLICGLVVPYYKGLPMYLMSPMTFLQRPLLWWQAISDYGVTQTVGPNFSYELSVRRSTPEQRAALHLEQVRIAGTAAEPIRHHAIEAFADAFAVGGFRRGAFLSGYGLAEATLTVAGGPLSWISVDGTMLGAHRVVPVPENSPNARVVVTCGAPQLDMDVRIVNPETLCGCAPDEVGEIWVRGPGNARGYWNKPEDSDRVFKAYLADTAEGPFLRTGDLGFMHRGEVFVTGRIKDLIILDGVNVYPQDIEWTSQSAHTAIRPGCCAAFSIEREGRERVVVAAEVAASTWVDDVVAAMNASVRRAVAEAHQIALEDVVFLKPGGAAKTSSGKIQRHAVRSGYLERTLDLWAQ